MDAHPPGGPNPRHRGAAHHAELGASIGGKGVDNPAVSAAGRWRTAVAARDDSEVSPTLEWPRNPSRTLEVSSAPTAEYRSNEADEGTSVVAAREQLQFVHPALNQWREKSWARPVTGVVTQFRLQPAASADVVSLLSARILLPGEKPPAIGPEPLQALPAERRGGAARVAGEPIGILLNPAESDRLAASEPGSGSEPSAGWGGGKRRAETARGRERLLWLLIAEPTWRKLRICGSFVP